MGETVDTQPAATEPVANTSSGIDGTAQFIPSDAKLDHATPPPEKPLATGDSDATMTDAPTRASTLHLTVQGLDTSLDGADAPKSEDAPASLDSISALPNGTASATESAATETPAAQPAQESASAPVDAPQDSAAPIAPTAESDQTMQDAPVSGLVRPREEEEGSDEPAAKRTKTEDNSPVAQPADVKPTVAESAPVAPAAPVTIPAATNGNAPHHPPAPSYSSEPMTPYQKQALLDKMKNTKKVKAAFWFLKPVDYVALNIPHYPDIIKHPMDLGTIEQKLKGDKYGSMDDLVADFELMVNNCIKFNGPTHAASAAALSMRAYFLKQLEAVPTGAAAAGPVKAKKQSPAPPKPVARRESRTAAAPGAARSPTQTDTFALLPGGTPMIRRESTAGRPKRAVIPPAPRDLPYSTTKPKRKEAQIGLKFCDHVLNEMKKPKYDKVAAAFLVPVDPVALNIPHYRSIIKEPMDISTITMKLKNGQYSNDKEFKGDWDLMFANCFKFNPADNIVHSMGKELQRGFEREWEKKDSWIAKNQPRSHRASSASDVGSDDDDSDAEEDDDVEHDNNEATIAMLRQQLESMQQIVANIGGKRDSPKVGGKKKKGSGKSKKSGSLPSAPRTTIKTKPKKQRLVTYEEKQEISNATEHMTAAQVEKLTNIITENVSKYKVCLPICYSLSVRLTNVIQDMAGEDVELEIDELPNEVQHKLLKFVRSIFPPARASNDEASAVDDDYEPERGGARGGNARKKHKPMKKHEQESSIKHLKDTLSQLQQGVSSAAYNAAPSRAAHHDSSDDDESESSEEE